MSQKPADDRPTFSPLVRAAVALLVLLLVTAGIKSWRDLADARAMEASLERDIADTQERILVLRDRLQRIGSDPATLEQLAREELGWVRDADVVIVLPEDAEVPAVVPTAGNGAALPPG